MKKFALFVFLLMMGVALFSAEQGTILSPLGSYSGISTVTELEIIHDLNGGAYILYIDGGEFHVLRRTEAAGLMPYEPEGFDRKPKQVRNLRNFAGSAEQYTAFIGREGDREELFLFGVNYKGELVYYPIRESGTNGTIDGYFLSCLMPDAFQIYILGEGQLYCLSGGESPETMKHCYPVSLPGEKVREFEIVLLEATAEGSGQSGAQGWYTAFTDGLWKLSLFSIEENGFLIREPAGTFNAPPKVIAGEDFPGGAIYKIINDSEVSVYRGSGAGFFKDFSFESPGTVKNYFTINRNGLEISLLLTGEGEADVMYRVSNETASIPVLKPLFTMDRDGFLKLKLLAAASGDDRVFLFFSLEGKPHFSIIGFGSDPIMSGVFSDLEDKAVFCYSGILDVFKVCILSNSENPSLLIYRYDQKSWTLERKIAVSIEAKNKNWLPETAPVLNPFYTESGIITLVERGMLFFYDLDRDLYQGLEKRKHRWSHKINDILYAVLINDGGIELYRMEG